MDQDNLNMEIRKFLKKVGITSQRIIENKINIAYDNGSLKQGDKLNLEMTLKIKNLDVIESITGGIEI